MGVASVMVDAQGLIPAHNPLGSDAVVTDQAQDDRDKKNYVKINRQATVVIKKLLRVGKGQGTQWSVLKLSPHKRERSIIFN